MTLDEEMVYARQNLEDLFEIPLRDNDVLCKILILLTEIKILLEHHVTKAQA